MAQAVASPAFAALISHIPLEWRGLLVSFYGFERPLAYAEAWFSTERGSQLGHPGTWNSLIESLYEEEPMSDLHSLQFKPRILHFPVHVQRLILAFLHHHRQDIVSSTLKKLLSSLDCHLTKDPWNSLLQNLLKDHVMHAEHKCTTQVSAPAQRICCGKDKNVYKFTSENVGQVNAILSQLSALNSSDTDRVTHLVQTPWNSMTNRALYDEIHGQNGLSKDDTVQYPVLTDGGLTSSQPDIPVLKEDTPEWLSSQSCKNFQADSSPTSFGSAAPKQRRVESSQGENDNTCDELSLNPVVNASQSEHNNRIDALLQARRLREFWITSDQESEIEIPEDVKSIASCSAEQMEAICQEISPSQLPDGAVVNACRHITSLSQELSHVNCVLFSRYCILPKIAGLTQNASRILLGAVINFSQVFPKPMAEGVIIPCLTSSQTESPQADLTTRIVKEGFNAETRESFMRDLLLKGSPIHWTETSVTVVQLLLDLKVTMDASVISSLIQSLERAALSFANSLKYGKILLAVITKYGKQLTLSDAAGLRQILEVHKTFLKKSALAALGQLKL